MFFPSPLLPSIFDGEKTIEGSVAFFTITLLVSLILLMLLTDMAEVNLIILSVIIAAFCTFIESDSWNGLDNLFVPIGAHILLVKLFDVSPPQLINALITPYYSIRCCAPEHPSYISAHGFSRSFLFAEISPIFNLRT